MNTAPAAGSPSPPGSDPSSTLPGEARELWRHASPRILAVALVVALVARLLVGGWRWWDVGVAVIIVGFQPFTEWLIHVFILHFRPRRILGARIDPLAGRKHRAHHRDPRNLDHVFIPLPVLAGLIAGVTIGYLAAMPALGLALTGIVTSLVIGLVYEWTHFLIHRPYRARRWYYRYVWRAHRLHHYRNEHYWFGVTVHLADHVLRTFPARDAVARSATARSLHAEPEAAIGG